MEFKQDETPSGKGFDVIDFSILSDNPAEKTTKLEYPEGVDEQTRNYIDSMHENYRNSEFPELVGELKKQFNDYQRPSDHPSYINEGTESAVFSIYDSEGQHFAARLPEIIEAYDIEDERHNINQYLGGFALGEGIDGLEQLTAASNEDRVVISPFLPGCTLDELSRADYKQMTSEHIQRLTDSISAGVDRGVEFDTVKKNFIFNPETGFTAIDYPETNTYDVTKPYVLKGVYRGFIGNDTKFPHFKPGLQNSVLEELHCGISESKNLDSRDKNALHEWIADPKRR